jgi:hypothetical protein
VAEDEPADEAPRRSARTDSLWADVRIDPVEIALPGGVGYTLRAYRRSGEVGSLAESADDVDDFEAAAAAVMRSRRGADGGDHDEDADIEDMPVKRRAGKDLAQDRKDLAQDRKDLDQDRKEQDLKEQDTLEDEDTFEEEELEEEDDLAEKAEDDARGEEEIPVFLGRNGRVYLFHSPEKLVEFVRSGADHDMCQLDTWSDLVGRIDNDDIVPLDEDSYELDLVVENLRGGPDAWEPTLILRAGEIARDLGFALRIDPVMVALATGSPLDDLDEALRAADRGGIGSFFAKRKLRKIPAQQSSLAWRTVIGKISAVADWRD